MTDIINMQAATLNDQAPTTEAITKSNVERADPKQQDTASLGQNLGAQGPGFGDKSQYKEYPIPLYDGVADNKQKVTPVDNQSADRPNDLTCEKTPTLQNALQPKPTPGTAPTLTRG